MRRVRSRTRPTAGPLSLSRCAGSGTGRTSTGIRSMVRMRSCQSESVMRDTGMPGTGVKAGGEWWAL